MNPLIHLCMAALLLAPAAGCAEQAAGQPKPAAADHRDPTARPVVGFTINLHHTQHLDQYLESVDQIAAMGCNTLQVITPAWQHNGASTDIYYKPGPGGGPTPEQLLTLLNHAKKRGLRTALMVTVLLEQPRGSEWRGKIMPDDWDAWWTSYHTVIHQAMDVALRAGVDDFAVGSELLTTEPERQRWTQLIASLRDRFDGRLYYSTNWDHYHVPRFWPQLDLIGINGYWNITTLAKDTDHPTHDELVARWRQIRTDLTNHAQRFDMPILITEVGYPALPWALKDPWNYVAPEGQQADPKAQAKGYRAFLEADQTPRNQPTRRLATRDPNITATHRRRVVLQMGPLLPGRPQRHRLRRPRQARLRPDQNLGANRRVKLGKKYQTAPPQPGPPQRKCSPTPQPNSTINLQKKPRHNAPRLSYLIKHCPETRPRITPDADASRPHLQPARRSCPERRSWARGSAWSRVLTRAPRVRGSRARPPWCHPQRSSSFLSSNCC